MWDIERPLLILSLQAATFVVIMMITFANILYPDQDRHSVGPDLDPNCFTL